MILTALENLELRQFVTTSLFFLSVCLVAVFGRYLFIEARLYGWKEVRSNRLNQAAIAFVVYFAGMIVARGWAMVAYKILESGGDVIALENQYPVALGAAGVALVGGLCCVRVFTRNARTWVYVLAAIAALTALVTAI